MTGIASPSGVTGVNNNFSQFASFIYLFKNSPTAIINDSKDNKGLKPLAYRSVQ
jgi:hypothetical protein